VGASVLHAAGALKTPARNGYNAQGVNLSCRASVLDTLLTANRSHETEATEKTYKMQAAYGVNPSSG